MTDAAVATILRVPSTKGSLADNSELAGGDIVQVCEYGDPDDPTAPRLIIQTTASDDYDLAVELLGSGADSVETIEIAGAEQASRLAKRKDRVDQHSVIVLGSWSCAHHDRRGRLGSRGRPDRDRSGLAAQRRLTRPTDQDPKTARSRSAFHADSAYSSASVEWTVMPPPVPSVHVPSPAVNRLRITTPRSAWPSAAIQPNAPAYADRGASARPRR